MPAFSAARAKAQARLGPGNACDYINPLTALQPGDRTGLAVRVSKRQQKRNGNDDGQEAWLRDKLAELRFEVEVVKTFRFVGSAQSCYSNEWGSAWLFDVVRQCVSLGITKLVAESTDRFVRHPLFRSNDPRYRNLQATTTDLSDLRDVTCGLTLITLLPPDASPVDVERHRSQRGQWRTGRRGGRPSKKRGGRTRRINLLPQVIELRKQGISSCEIAELLTIPVRTVYRWISLVQSECQNR